MSKKEDISDNKYEISRLTDRFNSFKKLSQQIEEDIEKCKEKLSMIDHFSIKEDIDNCIRRLNILDEILKVQGYSKTTDLLKFRQWAFSKSKTSDYVKLMNDITVLKKVPAFIKEIIGVEENE